MQDQHKKVLQFAVVALVIILAASFVYTKMTDTRFGGGYATQSSGLGGEMDYAMAPGEPMMMKSASLSADSEESFAISDDGANDVVETDRLIIKTGRFSVVVENVAEAINAVAKFTTDNGGFVVTSNIDEYSSIPSGSVTVRIPSELFDKGIDNAKSLGDVKSERVSGQDVTEEFVDLGARLKSLQSSEEQFLQIMKRAVKIEDVLAVQRELTRVRSQIESLEGRRKYLTESAKLSTMTINLSTDSSALPVIEDDTWKPLRTIKEAARDVVLAFQIIGDGIIWFVLYIPVILVYIGLLWIVYWLGMKVYKRIKK